MLYAALIWNEWLKKEKYNFVGRCATYNLTEVNSLLVFAGHISLKFLVRKGSRAKREPTNVKLRKAFLDNW